MQQEYFQNYLVHGLLLLKVTQEDCLSEQIVMLTGPLVSCGALPFCPNLVHLYPHLATVTVDNGKENDTKVSAPADFKIFFSLKYRTLIPGQDKIWLIQQ